jgi:hypothetical protein
MSLAARIAELKALHQAGDLTAEEFAAYKKELMAAFTRTPMRMLLLLPLLGTDPDAAPRLHTPLLAIP